MSLCWMRGNATGTHVGLRFAVPHARATGVVCLRPRRMASQLAAPQRPVTLCMAAIDMGSASEPKEAAVSPSAAEPDSDGPGFEQLGVDRLFLPGLARMNVRKPAEIQLSAIPEILALHNVAMQSYTGSGKTLAFLLPTMTLAIQRAEALYKAGAQEVPIQLLVVSPGQELAMQTTRVAQGLLPEAHRRTVQQCIGGANPKYQEDALLMNKPIIVVGTPGRVAEFIRMGVLKLHKCPILVLDEADQLLAPNFAEDLHHINEHCGRRVQPAHDRSADPSSGAAQRSDAGASSSSSRRGSSSSDVGGGADPSTERPRQTILVSATLSQSLLGRTAKWCPNPRFVTQGKPPAAPAVPVAEAAAPARAAPAPAWGWGAKGWDGPASDLGPKTEGSAGGVQAGGGEVPPLPPNLKHYYVVVPQRHKADALRRCIHALDVQRALVFMNYQQRLKDTMFRLEARKMKSASLHGEMSKFARSSILSDFRRGRLRALVVSDVVARGLDVSGCDAVFNAELPSSRMDAPGTVVSIVTPTEAFVVGKLARRLGVEITEAYTSHGQLVLGPAPAAQRFDDDEGDGDAAEPRQASSSRTSSSSSSSSGGRSSREDSGRAEQRRAGNAVAGVGRAVGRGQEADEEEGGGATVRGRDGAGRDANSRGSARDGPSSSGSRSLRLHGDGGVGTRRAAGTVRSGGAAGGDSWSGPQKQAQRQAQGSTAGTRDGEGEQEGRWGPGDGGRATERESRGRGARDWEREEEEEDDDDGEEDVAFDVKQLEKRVRRVRTDLGRGRAGMALPSDEGQPREEGGGEAGGRLSASTASELQREMAELRGEREAAREQARQGGYPRGAGRPPVRGRGSRAATAGGR